MTDTKACLQISHVINALTMMDAANLEGLQPAQRTAIQTTRGQEGFKIKNELTGAGIKT